MSGAMEMYEEALDFGKIGPSQKRSACFELGLLKEVSGDVTTAVRLFEDAARLGHPGAQLSMAVAVSSAAYPDTGWRPERFQNASREDVAVLHEYFAALGDEPLAQMALGYRHMYGVGVPVRCEAAVEYYGAAADAAVRASRGEVWVPNDRIRIGEEDVPVSEWWAGSSLFSWAKKEGGAAATAGGGNKKSHLLRYYQHAARQGDVHSQLTLGHLHYHGSRFVKQNLTKARRWFSAAAEKGDAVASSWLGYMEVKGLGGPQTDGIDHLVVGEKHGEHIALIGLGVAKLKAGNRSAANAYFKKASKKHPDAIYN
ncbi:MAG: tetratricopeptide repeat protein, partial [Planctomycetota bacterium]